MIFPSNKCQNGPQATIPEPPSIPVMAWCHQASNNYQNQCWPSSITMICSIIKRIKQTYEIGLQIFTLNYWIWWNASADNQQEWYRQLSLSHHTFSQYHHSFLHTCILQKFSLKLEERKMVEWKFQRTCPFLKKLGRYFMAFALKQPTFWYWPGCFSRKALMRSRT